MHLFKYNGLSLLIDYHRTSLVVDVVIIAALVVLTY